MKIFIAALISVLAIGVLGIVQSAKAAEYKTDSSVVVKSDEVVDDDLYVSGNIVQINGTVEGDVYVAGQNIIINGQIGGDLLAAGSTITVNGDVNGSIRAGGQTLNIVDSEVGGGVSFFGAALSTTTETNIGQGVLFFGESATINGRIAYGLTAYGTTVSINGEVGRKSNITSQNLKIEQDAVISGDLEYRSDQEADIADTAQIVGEVEHTGDFRKYEIGFDVGKYVFTAWSFLAALVTGLVLLLLARKPLGDTAGIISRRPLASLGWGFLALLAVIPVGILLAITVLGLPMALLLWAGFLASLYISKFIVGIAMGRQILERFGNQKNPHIIYSFLLGLVTLYAINLIPVVTVFASIVIASLGLGAIVMRLYGGIRSQYAKPSKKKT